MKKRDCTKCHYYTSVVIHTRSVRRKAGKERGKERDKEEGKEEGKERGKVINANGNSPRKVELCSKARAINIWRALKRGYFILITLVETVISSNHPIKLIISSRDVNINYGSKQGVGELEKHGKMIGN